MLNITDYSANNIKSQQHQNSCYISYIYSDIWPSSFTKSSFEEVDFFSFKRDLFYFIY